MVATGNSEMAFTCLSIQRTATISYPVSKRTHRDSKFECILSGHLHPRATKHTAAGYFPFRHSSGQCLKGTTTSVPPFRLQKSLFCLFASLSLIGFLWTLGGFLRTAVVEEAIYLKMIILSIATEQDKGCGMFKWRWRLHNGNMKPGGKQINLSSRLYLQKANFTYLLDGEYRFENGVLKFSRIFHVSFFLRIQVVILRYNSVWIADFHHCFFIQYIQLLRPIFTNENERRFQTNLTVIWW